VSLDTEGVPILDVNIRRRVRSYYQDLRDGAEEAAAGRNDAWICLVYVVEAMCEVCG
jgi:hypothetical protein